MYSHLGDCERQSRVERLPSRAELTTCPETPAARLRERITLRCSLVWSAALLTTLALCAGLCAIPLPVLRADVRAPATTTNAPRLDPVDYDRVQSLRSSLALADADLAAVGIPTRASVEIVNTLVNWYRENTAAIATVEAQRLGVLRERAEFERQARLGTLSGDVSARRAALSQQLREYTAERRRLEESAGVEVAGAVPAELLESWKALLANRALPESLRYVPNLTRDEAAKLQKLFVAKARGVNMQPEIERIIGGTRAAAAEAAQARVRMNTPAIASAVAEALPGPEDPAATRSTTSATRDSDSLPERELP